MNPISSPENEYVQKVTEILGELGHIQKLPGVKRALIFPFSILFSKRDYAVLHWVESTILNGYHRLSWLNVIRAFLYVHLLKLTSKTLVMIRHNNYPHETRPEELQQVLAVLQRFEQCFDIIVTHSGHNAGGRYTYVPHPLYTPKNPSPGRVVHGDYFLVFGRILPYKNIKELIASLAPDVHLVVAGSAPDQEYLAECKRVAAGKTVTFLTGYIEHQVAANLAINSKGLVVPNGDDDMVVSGSYFFAFTYLCNVYTIATPFIRWVVGQLNPGGIYSYGDVHSLGSALKSTNTHTKRIDPKIIESAFGATAIREAWAAALAKKAQE